MPTEWRPFTFPVFLLLALDLREKLPVPMLSHHGGDWWCHIELTQDEAYRTAARLKAYRETHRHHYPHIHGTAIVTLDRPDDLSRLTRATEPSTAGFVYDSWIDDAQGQWGGTFVRWEKLHGYRRALG